MNCFCVMVDQREAVGLPGETIVRGSYYPKSGW